MNKINLLSNSRIMICKTFYDNTIEDEWIDLTPDTIPAILIPAIRNAFGNSTILRLSMFLDMSDPNINKLSSIAYLWDGIICVKKDVDLFGDGSYNIKRTEVL